MEGVEHGGRRPASEKATPAEAGSEPVRRGTPPPPLPVRSTMSAPPSPQQAGAVQAPTPHVRVELEMEGVRWVVRELGRSGSPRAPLLLLGFFHPDDPEEPRREALVTARGLDGLTELQVEAAWRASIGHVRAGTRRPFFPEVTARGARDG